MKDADHDPRAEAGSRRPRSRKVAQILPAAAELFLDSGFDTVTMDMVVARSGVSKATLYVYFASKEDLFAAVVDEEVRQLTARIAIPDHDGGDIEAVLRTSAEGLIELVTSERTVALQKAVVGVLPRFPGLGERIFDAGPHAVRRKLAALLACARDDGRLNVADALVAARQFMSLVREDYDLKGLLSLPPPDRATIERSIDEAIAMFMARYGVS